MQGRAETLLDVLNFVLSTLGSDECNSWQPAIGIQPETAHGQKVARVLLKCIDDVQRTFYWHELIESATISADATDHYSGRKRYALPPACLRPLGLRLTAGETGLAPTTLTRLAHDSDYEYFVEGDFIVTYSESVDVVYIKRSDDPTEWTSELLDCVQAKAAAESCMMITKNRGFRQELLDSYREASAGAKRLQSKYKSTERYLPSGFTALNMRMSR